MTLQQVLVVDLKAFDSEANSDSESNPEGGKQIINVEPSAMITTTKVWPSEPEEPEEGNASFTRRCGSRGLRLISFSTVVVRRT
jgi:hypothetical protein